jgi:hypothetical protein
MNERSKHKTGRKQVGGGTGFDNNEFGNGLLLRCKEKAQVAKKANLDYIKLKPLCIKEYH